VDDNGNVANFVETEQITIRSDGVINSFVQIRGSVPLYWQQLAALKYTARINFVADAQHNLHAINRHFVQLNELYGDVVVVNLIDKKRRACTGHSIR